VRIIAAAHVVAPDKTENSFFDEVEFDLVDCPIPNCFATGGKHVYVYAGLFKFCQSEEELATAMCVAYAHLINLDVENIGIVPDPARTMRQDVWQFVTKPFNAQQEQAADQLAFEIYTKAGWDGMKFEYLFQRVGDEYSAPADAPREAIAARAMAAHALSRTASLADRLPNVADRRMFAELRRSAVALSGNANGEGELYLLALPNIVLSHELPQEQAAQERLRPPPPSQVPLEPN
jgi:predicted Zn-dependent protease